MSITDIATVAGKGIFYKDVFCIAAALAFARDCARTGSFDTERYGSLAENWLKELKD